MRAIVWLAATRIALPLFGFARVRRYAERIAQRSGAPGDVQTVRRGMQRAVRTHPGSTCLAHAITAIALLRREGIAGELTVGVARESDAANPLAAHAWVRSGSIVVIGEAELERYSELVTFRPVT